MEPVRPRGTDKAEVMQVIQTTSLLGLGTQKDPVRYIYQTSANKKRPTP